MILPRARLRDGAALVAGLLAGAAVGLFTVLTLDRRDPVHLHALREVDGVAVRGGRLELLVNLDRARDCPTTTTRWLWSWTSVDGERVKFFVPLGSSTSGVTEPGEAQRFVLSLAIPSDIQPGEWFYWSKSVDDCGGPLQLSRPSIRETPSTPVRIVSRGEQGHE